MASRQKTGISAILLGALGSPPIKHDAKLEDKWQMQRGWWKILLDGTFKIQLLWVVSIVILKFWCEFFQAYMEGNSPWSFLSVMLSQNDFDFQVGRKSTILLETQVLPWLSRNLWRGKVNTRTENEVEKELKWKYTCLSSMVISQVSRRLCSENPQSPSRFFCVRRK